MQKSYSADNQQVSEEEKAWLAGIIDGEGCVTLVPYYPHGKDKTRYYAPSIYIYNTCPIMMVKVAEVINKIGVGRHITQRHFNPNRGMRKVAISIQVYGFQRVAKLIVAILPYLTSRQEEALLLFKFCNERINGAKPAPQKFVPYTKEQELIVTKLQEIKRLRHLREHTPDSVLSIEKMCAELHSDMQRIAEMTIPNRIK